jgi:inhibitor of KinA sporulation pathway (predicted exonuclease)
MTIQRDVVVIVDIESTCWEHDAPAGEQSEIIEVGVCTLDVNTLTRADKRSLIIKPTESSVSAFCTKLTTITPEMVEDGIDFADACRILQADYDTDNRLWVSWGNYDRRMFIEQTKRRDILYPFSDNHCNLKNLFANFYGRRMGMETALEKINLELEGTHHRGDDDAWNIAAILAHLIQENGRDVLSSFW